MEKDMQKFEERHPAIVPTKVDSSPAGLMQSAMAGGMDLKQIEKMLELQIKREDREAKKAYFSAMAAFKTNPPEIGKDKRFFRDFRLIYCIVDRISKVPDCT